MLCSLVHYATFFDNITDMTELYSPQGRTAFRRIIELLKLEKAEISAIYFYAILSGLIQLIVPVGVQAIINFLQAMQYSTSLVILIILVVAGVFINGVMQLNQIRLIEKIQQSMFVRYAYEYSRRFPQLDLKSVDGYYLPELANRFFDTVSLQKSISKILLDIPAALIQILFGLILLSVFAPVFILFGLVLLIILYFIMSFTYKQGLASSIRESDYKYKVAGWIEELARLVHSFKFSKGTSINLSKADEYVDGYLRSRTEHFRILMIQNWAFVSFKTLITAAMLIIGSYLFISNNINLGQFVAAEIVILTVINSIEKLIIRLDNVYDVLTSVEKLGHVLDKPLEKNGQFELVNEAGGMSILLDDLHFSYKDKKVLQHVSMEVRPGEKICIMGAEGSGKSTLLRILAGSYPDYHGGILINGVPLGNYNKETLRNKTGVLLEQQAVFHGTLLENITMGNDNISTHDIVALSEVVGLKDYISDLPNGYETQLDPTGKKLSKNIVQKILLMRAMSGNPALLLLEDPLHALDEASKQKVMDHIFRKMPLTTVIIASYDESSASLCDKVLYLGQDGKPIAFDNWNQLSGVIKKKLS